MFNCTTEFHDGKTLFVHFPSSSTALEISDVPPPTFFNRPPLILSFVTEILILLRPSVELVRTADPFVVLSIFFDTHRTLQNILQLHTKDIQTLTFSTIHVNDSLKKRVFFDTLTQFTSSF